MLSSCISKAFIGGPPFLGFHCSSCALRFSLLVLHFKVFILCFEGFWVFVVAGFSLVVLHLKGFFSFILLSVFQGLLLVLHLRGFH